jgi:hypothetical protein
VNRVYTSILEQQLGIGARGRAYTLVDNRDQAWEAEEEDNKAAQEELWQADEKRNKEIALETTVEIEKGKEHVAISNLVRSD